MLISIDMTADYITGIFISMMFAGHHTSSGTAAWTMIELMRHPDVKADIVSELDDLYADGSDVSFQALRSIPLLESALKETLRLHPPLIILLRLAQEEIELAGHTISPGTMVAASPRVSNRIAADFPEPDAFDPARYLDPRQEDLANRWTWIPFGAGKHRCVGNAFAMMQLKAIFSVLLRDWEFEMTQPSESYRDDCSKMVIQLEQPCRVKYRRRERTGGFETFADAHSSTTESSVVEEGEERARLETTGSSGFETLADARSSTTAESGCPFPHGDDS